MTGAARRRRPGLLGLALLLAALPLAAAGSGTAAASGSAAASDGAGAATDGRSFAEAALEDGAAPTVDKLPAVVLDAHRGGGLEARENSMSGIEHALRSGVVDVIDLDVRRLGDGTLGVMHDATVDRVTTSSGPTSAYTRAEWRELTLDIGAWLVPAPPRHEAPPTLSKVLKRFGDETVFTVEVKEGLLDEVAELLRALRLRGSVLVNTNKPDVARSIHDLGMRAHLWRSSRQMRRDDPDRWAAWLDVVDVDVRAARADIRKFVRSGIPRVWAHTVTTRAERNRVMRLGVDGVVTDDPRYLSGRTDRFPASATVVGVSGLPRVVQVSDRARARVLVSSESGPVLPEAEVTVAARLVSVRTAGHPRPGATTVTLSAGSSEKGRTPVRFTVPAGHGAERRWHAGRAAAGLRVAGEDLQLVPQIEVAGRRLEVAVRLLDSAARDYQGRRAEHGTEEASLADLDRSTVVLHVLRDGKVVHRQRLAGADTGKVGNGVGAVTFAPFEAARRGRYTVRLDQRGPVYRHVAVERGVRLR